MPGYLNGHGFIGAKKFYRTIEYWETIELGSPYIVYATFQKDFTGSPYFYVTTNGEYISNDSDKGIKGTGGMEFRLQSGWMNGGKLWHSSGGTSNCYATMCESDNTCLSKVNGRLMKFDFWAQRTAAGPFASGEYIGATFGSSVLPFNTAYDWRHMGWAEGDVNTLRATSGWNEASKTPWAGSPASGDFTAFAHLTGGYSIPKFAGRYNANSYDPEKGSPTQAAAKYGGKYFVKHLGTWKLAGIDSACNTSWSYSRGSLTSSNTGGITRPYDVQCDNYVCPQATYPELHYNVGNYTAALGPGSSLTDRGWTIHGATPTGSGEEITGGGGSPSAIWRDMGFGQGVMMWATNRGASNGPSGVFCYKNLYSYIGVRPLWSGGLYDDLQVYYLEGSPTPVQIGILGGCGYGQLEPQINVAETTFSVWGGTSGGARYAIPAEFQEGGERYSTKWGIRWFSSADSWVRHVDIQPQTHDNYTNVLNGLG